MFLAGDGAAAARSTRSCRSTSCSASCPATRRARPRSRSTARTRAGSARSARRSQRRRSSINVDHHHDNTRFGAVNLDRPRRLVDRRDRRATSCASSASTLTPEIAEALYVALVTDTGRFQYTNTTPKALRLAAELVEAGADVHRVFQGIYESRPVREAEAAGAGARARADLRGRPARRLVPPARRLRRGRRRRAVLGGHHRLPARRRGRRHGGADPRAAAPRDAPTRRVSLRASRDELDVSAIARESGAGGGHRQAAGFSSDDSIEEITEFIRREFAAARNGSSAERAYAERGSCSSTSRPGRRRSRSSRQLRDADRSAGRARGDARPVRHRAPARPARARRRGWRSASSGSTSAT